jgi:hypothetical protein
MTLKLDLRSHASRDIALEQDGPRRTSTFGHVDLGVYLQVLSDDKLQVGDEVLEAMTLAKFVS